MERERNGYALAAHRSSGGPMRHRLSPKGGSRREDYESEEWDWTVDVNAEHGDIEDEEDR
jgi:hypothetical protein